MAVNQTATTKPSTGESYPLMTSSPVGIDSSGRIVPYLPENSSNGTRENGSALAVVPPDSSALTAPASGDNTKISPYEEAIQDITNPPDPKNLNLDQKASSAWLGGLGFLKDSATKVFNFASGILGDSIPAATYALDKAGASKKTNGLLTHLALGGAGLLALTSATDFINTFKTWFKWQAPAVPGVVDFINGLAKVGLAGLVAGKAMTGEPIEKNELIYGGAGLVLLKLVKDAMKGVGPFASIPGVKDLIYFTRDSIKALGSGSRAAEGQAPQQ
ncbi:MAG: hypothetical protein ACKO3R_07650 [bacterium]